MTFDEKLAREIIARHNLADSTLKVWRTRGAIPDQYANENYTRPEQLAAAKRVLGVPHIAWSVLPKSQSLLDFMAGKQSLHSAQYESLKSECESIRKVLLEFASAPSERTWKKIYADPRIHAYKVFSSVLLDRARKGIMVTPKELSSQVNEAKLLASKIKMP